MRLTNRRVLAVKNKQTLWIAEQLRKSAIDYKYTQKSFLLHMANMDDGTSHTDTISRPTM